MRQNLEVRQGQTYTFTHVHKVAGSPVDLSGFSARMAIKYRYESLYAAYLSSGPDTVDGAIVMTAQGLITITMTPGQTEVLANDLGLFLLERWPDYRTQPVERFIYDLEITAPDGAVTRVLEGVLRLYRSVTTE